MDLKYMSEDEKKVKITSTLILLGCLLRSKNFGEAETPKYYKF
jgi:hypothetical protein